MERWANKKTDKWMDEYQIQKMDISRQVNRYQIQRQMDRYKQKDQIGNRDRDQLISLYIDK